MNSSVRKVPNIEIEDISKVIGIALYMGMFKLPNCMIYWNRRSGNKMVPDAMSGNRFDEIMIVLHFKDSNAILSKRRVAV